MDRFIVQYKKDLDTVEDLTNYLHELDSYDRMLEYRLVGFNLTMGGIILVWERK